MARSGELVRPRRGRVIAGVCAALARRFDMRPWQVRLIFVLSCLLPGPQFLLYIALAAAQRMSATATGRSALPQHLLLAHALRQCATTRRGGAHTLCGGKRGPIGGP